jgi:carbonic anhydrase
MVLYGNLMEMVDSNNRWIYAGSVTTPPCARFVYWNVISTIYPVSQKHLDQFKAQLEPLEGGNLADYGNWREIMPEDDHGVAYISSSVSSAS